MNGEDRKRIALAHLKKAKQFLETAKFLKEHKMIDSAINRCYYAAFHAVDALLVHIGLSPKTHKGALNLFFLHFVEPQYVSLELNRDLNRLFAQRMDADYGFISSLVTEEDIAQGISVAEEIIAFAQEWITSGS